MMDRESMSKFLSKHNLEDISETLKTNEFDCLNAILEISEEDMIEMQFSLGKRRKLAAAIQIEKKEIAATTSVQASSSSKGQQPAEVNVMIENIRERINQLREHRRKKDQKAAKPSEKMGPVKLELNFHVGLKRMTSSGELKLVKGEGGMRKLKLQRKAGYQEVLLTLSEIFNVNPEQAFLINNANVRLSKDFTVANYIENYTYTGVTRLYLAEESSSSLSSPTSDDEDEQPPVLTPQKPQQDLTKSNLRTCDKTEPSSSKMAETTDVLNINADNESASDHHASSSSEKTQICTENIKKDEKLTTSLMATVTYDQVKAFALEDIKEETADKFDESNQGELKESKQNCTPVHSKNACVQLFKDMKEKQGIVYEVRCSGWGVFVLIPNEDLEEFFAFRKSFDETYLAIINPSLLYFLATTELEVQCSVMSKNVLSLGQKLGGAYDAWYEKIKQSVEME